MVLNCVAYGCNVVHDARSKISFHAFPFKRPEILKLWIAAVRRENWHPSKTSKLCGKHFVATDYLIKPGCTAKLLKPDAVPSVFLFPKHLIKKVPLPRRKMLKKNEDTASSTSQIEVMDISYESSTPIALQHLNFALRVGEKLKQPPENSGQPNVEFVATTESKIDVLDIKNEPLEPLFIPETSSMPTVECLPEHVSTITGKHDVLDIKNEPLEPHIASIPGTSSQPTIEFLPEHVPTITGQVTETSKKPATKKNISNKIICRMCLEPVTKNQMVPLSLIDVNYPGKSESFKQSKAVKIEKVVSMILVVMPDFDFDVAYNPIICHKCNAHLESAFNFVQGCRANEKLIHLYKAKLAPNEELISCDDVAQQKNYLMKEMPPPKKLKTSNQYVRSTTVRNLKQLESGVAGDGNEIDRNVAQEKDHLTKDMPPQKKLKSSNENVRSTIVRNFRQFAGRGDGIEGNVNSEMSRNQENIVVESAPESGLIKHEIEDLDYGNGAGTSNCMITAEELSSIVKEEDIVVEDIPLEPYDTSTDDWSISQAEVNAIVKKNGSSEKDPVNYIDYQDNSQSVHSS